LEIYIDHGSCWVCGSRSVLVHTLDFNLGHDCSAFGAAILIALRSIASYLHRLYRARGSRFFAAYPPWSENALSMTTGLFQKWAAAKELKIATWREPRELEAANQGAGNRIQGARNGTLHQNPGHQRKHRDDQARSHIRCLSQQVPR
jgi:hypothetical protein